MPMYSNPSSLPPAPGGVQEAKAARPRSMPSVGAKPSAGTVSLVWTCSATNQL